MKKGTNEGFRKAGLQRKYWLYDPDDDSCLVKGDDLREKPRTFLPIHHPEFDATRIAKFQEVGHRRKGHPAIDTEYAKHVQDRPHIVVVEELPLLADVTHRFKK